MSCIAANLGSGLDFNETTRQLELRISTDAGNVAAIGSDDGFYSPAGSAPGPMVWPRTVATLPAQAMAASEGSGLVIPATSPYGVEYTIANGIDIYTASTFMLADGTSFVHLDDRNDPINRYTDNPSAVEQQYLSSTNLPSLRYDAGTRVSPTARNAPSEFTDPDGGWGGFYSRTWAPMTLSELLRMTRGRAVLALFVRFEGMTQADDAQAIASVQSVVDAIVEAGAQDWCIVMPQDNYEDSNRTPLQAMMDIIIGAGITGGVNVLSDANTTNPWSAAEIAATGATWVDIASPAHPFGATEARILEFINAGLETMVFTNSRQYWTDWSFDLGARSVRVRDAVYARGGRGQAGDLDYRQTFIPGLETHTAAIGGITPLNSASTAVFNQGFARQDQTGRWFPREYGWSGSTAVYMNHALLGTICPMPDTTNFIIRLQIYRESRPSSTTLRWGGIFFGAADDRDISQPQGGPANTIRNGYNCIVHETTTSGTRMGIYRHDNGVSTTLTTTAGGPGWPGDEIIDLEVEVLADEIEFRAIGSTSTATIQAFDTTYRGPYAYHSWYDVDSSWVHAYDNPAGLVMYEALS